MTVTDLDIPTLSKAYREGSLTPRAVAARVLELCDAGDPRIWIHRLSAGAVLAYADRLEGADPGLLPLYGIPFAIKDNIDLAGEPTSAGCPEFAFVPGASATAVEKLIAAGAIPIGKTNLDQFATGLVGVRSPHGHPANPFNAAYIPGGSSSGSAVAVAAGLVTFALGTDTAGSGRVPAALNHLVGLKPTPGLVSCRGVVPACRSLDCVTVFAKTVAESARVLEVMAGFDAADPHSRSPLMPSLPHAAVSGARIGIPQSDQLEFFGDTGSAAIFAEAVARCRDLGWDVREIDFAPFLEAARLLYEGPWVAERLAAIESFLNEHADAVYPVTRRIIEGGRSLTAVAAFRAGYRLRELKRLADAAWDSVDAMLTPTIGCPYTVAEVEADPIRLNSNLGHYTNFMNLLDYAAVAVPAGFLIKQGMPSGVTLFGPAFQDGYLLKLAGHFLGEPVVEAPAFATDEPRIEVAVCGAHLSGLPLNHQLTSRNGRLVERCRTAPVYRMFALPPTGPFPARPGLVRDGKAGKAIEIEIWSVPASAFGSFVDGIGSPLGIGKLLTDSGREVSGFLCETWATEDAEEITRFGGWRGYVGSLG